MVRQCSLSTLGSCPLVKILVFARWKSATRWAQSLESQIDLEIMYTLMLLFRFLFLLCGPEGSRLLYEEKTREREIRFFFISASTTISSCFLSRQHALTFSRWLSCFVNRTIGEDPRTHRKPKFYLYTQLQVHIYYGVDKIDYKYWQIQNSHSSSVKQLENAILSRKVLSHFSLRCTIAEIKYN